VSRGALIGCGFFAATHLRAWRDAGAGRLRGRLNEGARSSVRRSGQSIGKAQPSGFFGGAGCAATACGRGAAAWLGGRAAA